MTTPLTVDSRKPTPYDTAIPFMAGNELPRHVGSRFDQLRLCSYRLYDSIYKNVSGTFKLTSRGTENNPVYIPSGKAIVEACNRYLGKDFDYNVNGATASEQQAAKAMLDKVLRNNKFWSKFSTQKRYGLIRGDSMWHVVVPNATLKDPLRRIKILELDPSTAFAITHPDDINDIVGWLIIQIINNPSDLNQKIVRRQKYSINDDGTIQSSLDYYKTDAWDDRIDPDTGKPFQQNVIPLARDVYQYQVVIDGEKQFDEDGEPLLADTRGVVPFSITLDERIDHLPVYHIKNNRAPLDPFGVSEISGIERLVSAINQAISDEELTLALDGLGVYATTSGPPVDDEGNPTNWVLGPGRVVEHEPGSTFERVDGAGSVKPAQDHLTYLGGQIRQTTATADAAMGIVNVEVAQSGIALALQMSPLLAKNSEKENEMIGEYADMLTDILIKWMPVFAGYTPPAEVLDVTPMFGDAMPVDRDAVIQEIVALVTAKIITVQEAQKMLHDKLGFEFTMSTTEDLAKEQTAMASARDPFASRIADLNNQLGSNESNQQSSGLGGLNNGAA